MDLKSYNEKELNQVVSLLLKLLINAFTEYHKVHFLHESKKDYYLELTGIWVFVI